MRRISLSRSTALTLARISRHAGQMATGVPLLGTSSAGRDPLKRHCSFQAVAHYAVN